MPNRNLNADELKHANELLADIRERLTGLAAGDRLLLFAYRRKVIKELGYDERDKPGVRAQPNSTAFIDLPSHPAYHTSTP